MKKSVIYALKLFLICAVATFVLALTNNATQPVIVEAEKQKVLEAFQEVYPGLEEARPIEDTSLLTENITEINEAVVGGEVDGYLYTVASPNGYDGPINFVVGAKKDGTVTGLKIISQTETSGFGARVANPEYAAGMQGVILTQPLVAEGNGGGPDKIPALSGATRTTTAMKNAMNMVVEAQAALTGTDVDTSIPMSELTDDQKAAAFPQAELALKEEAATDDVVREVYEATLNGESAGYVFHVTEPEGYYGSIEFLIGLYHDGTVAGFSMVHEEETEEFGGKIATPEYAQELSGKPLAEAPFAVTGATFTTQGMEHAIEAVTQSFEALGK